MDFSIKKGLHLPDGIKRPKALSSRMDEELLLAEVQQVSPESASFSAQALDGRGQMLDIPLTFPGVGYGSFMGVMPEPGALAMLFKMSDSDRFHVLGYLPPDPHGGRKYRMLEKWSAEDGNYQNGSHRSHTGDRRYGRQSCYVAFVA